MLRLVRRPQAVAVSAADIRRVGHDGQSVISQRIEYRIEPEQRGSQRRKLSEKFALLFRRERGDDFLKARIAA